MADLLRILDVTLLNSIFRFVTPILLAGLGGLICARVGILNIALEGLMLTGTFAAFVGSFYAVNSSVGVITAMLAGAALAAVFAFLAITLRGDQIVLGIAMNFLGSGMTVFLLRAIFGVKGSFDDPRIQGLKVIDIPGVESLPVIGPLLSGHTWVTYLSWLIVVGMFLLLFRHPYGLRMRGVGEHPKAASTLGINVSRMRYLVVILSGMLSGLAGAQLSLGNVTVFVENMSAGRGWIAFVAVMLGQAHPFGVFAASVFFGFADALGFRLQGIGFPSQFTEMIPYLITLISLVALQIRRRRVRT